LPHVHPKLGKEGRGDVLVVGGSAQVPGAVVLAALGALRAGAGRMQIATARSVAGHVAVTVPEARVIGLPQTRRGELARGCHRLLKREVEAANALLIGPGMCEEVAAVELLRQCFGSRLASTLVVDAGALHAFKGEQRPRSKSGVEVILTPHSGEMATMWRCSRDEVVARPLEIARQSAATLNAVVALKGAQTFVVAPDGTAYRNTAGNVGLGTSGSGDALSGVIAGLSARGATPLQAAVWGVYLHAKAGDILARRIGALGFLARELLAEIPQLLVKHGR
jgi:hydroxyethylthiazole kinase-like uncharacterized protein yjeF